MTVLAIGCDKKSLPPACNRCLDGILRRSCHAGSTCPAFDCSRLVVTDWSGSGEPDMTDLTCQVGCTAVKLAVQDQAGSNPGTHGQEDHVLSSLSGAKSALSQGTGIRVVFQKALDPKLIFKNGLDWNILRSEEHTSELQSL